MTARAIVRTSKPVKRTVHVAVIQRAMGADPVVFVAGNPRLLAEKVARMYVLPMLETRIPKDPYMSILRKEGFGPDFAALAARFDNGLEPLAEDVNEALAAGFPKTNTMAELIRRAIRAGAVEDAVDAFFRVVYIMHQNRYDDNENWDQYFTFEQTADFRR